MMLHTLLVESVNSAVRLTLLFLALGVVILVLYYVINKLKPWEDLSCQCENLVSKSNISAN